jgi:hypothetical protein
MKTICHYESLHTVVATGENATIVPVDHPQGIFNGERVIVGPVLTVIERVNDARPIFETHYMIFLPADIPVA